MSLIDELETRKSYLKVREAAALLSFSPSQVYSMVESNRLPALRVGSSVRICPRALAAYLRGRAA